MSRRPRRPRWYFSLRSPYSWLAWRDLVTDHPDVADQVEWIPFWEPDEPARAELADQGVVLPYVPMSADKHRYILQDVRRLTRARNLAITWPVDREPWWEPSHLGYLAAAELGVGKEYVAQMYRLRWEEGANISDPAVVVAAGERIGLDPAAARRLGHAADDPQLRAEGMAVLRRIRDDGVFGVPMFIDGFERYWGLDRLPSFCEATRASRAARAEERLVGAATGPSPDQGHAGGCG